MGEKIPNKPVFKDLMLINIPPPPEGIPTLMQWRSLRGHMNPRAMLTVAYATGRASHATQVKGDDPDEKGYPGPPGWGLGVGLTTPHCKNNLFQNLTISLGGMRNVDEKSLEIGLDNGNLEC